jgi:hypothetical protein
LSTHTPTLAEFGVKDGELVLRLQALHHAPRTIHWPETLAGMSVADHDTKATPTPEKAPWDKAEIIRRIDAALDRIEAAMKPHAPKGKFALDRLTPEQSNYFFCREQLNKVEGLLEAYENAETQVRLGSGSVIAKPKIQPLKYTTHNYDTGADPYHKRLRDAVDLKVEMSEFENETTNASITTNPPLAVLLRELVLLEAMAKQPVSVRPVLVYLQALHGATQGAESVMAHHYEVFLGQHWGTSVRDLSLAKQNAAATKMETQRSKVLLVTGPNTVRLLQLEAGNHLVRSPDGKLGILHVSMMEVDGPDQAEHLARQLMSRHSHSSVETLNSQEAMTPVIRLIQFDKAITDFRTGVVHAAVAPDKLLLAMIFNEPVATLSPPEAYRTLLLSTLPLPPELEN